MHLDPLLTSLVGASFVVLLVGLVMRRLGQPHVVAYLLAGVVLGGHGLNLLGDPTVAHRLGEFGVVMLLFFLGMEVSLASLASNWRVAILGTGLQIGVTVLLVLAVGGWLGWPTARSVLIGFVLALSSTAVVVSMLRGWGRLNDEIGRDAVSVLLVQDLGLAPMLLVVSLLAAEPPPARVLVGQALGGAALLGVAVWALRRAPVSLPFVGRLKDDHELQDFAAFVLCFGLALLSAFAGLSTALGAFVAGIVVASAQQTGWVHHALDPLRVVFVALFFASVGMMIEPEAFAGSWQVIAGLALATLLVNTLINALILVALGRRWRNAWYAGALLAQIGEFSFVLAAVGKQTGVISAEGYQLAVGTIAVTLLVSPAWTALVGRLTAATAATATAR